jgi:transcriptional regulator GlxA family with amidase domain
MKILIYLYDGVTALDAIGPYESLSRLPGVEIRFVGRRAGPVRTGDGFLGLIADTGINDEIEADMLIVPGGRRAGVQRELGEERVLGWMAVLDSVTRRTCSVCTGSLILGAAGLLEGRRASTHWGARDYLGHFNAAYSPERVTEDGKYLTSAGVSAGIDLGFRLCAEIAGPEVAEAVQLSMEYDPDPRFDAGDFKKATPERLAMVGKLNI